MDDLRNRAIVRQRAKADISVLCDVLAGQQPSSRYPLEWPLPFPVEKFIARNREQRAWVAEVDRRTVGHISVVTVDGADEGLARRWSEAAGVGVDALACVAAFFVGLEQQGNGLGGLLLDTAVTWARARGMVPVLDVVQRAGRAVDVYRHRGWRDVGEARPAWLPDGEPPVLLMILPASAKVPRP